MNLPRKQPNIRPGRLGDLEAALGPARRRNSPLGPPDGKFRRHPFGWRWQRSAQKNHRSEDPGIIATRPKKASYSWLLALAFCLVIRYDL